MGSTDTPKPKARELTEHEKFVAYEIGDMMTDALVADLKQGLITTDDIDRFRLIPIRRRRAIFEQMMTDIVHRMKAEADTHQAALAS